MFKANMDCIVESPSQNISACFLTLVFAQRTLKVPPVFEGSGAVTPPLA